MDLMQCRLQDKGIGPSPSHGVLVLTEALSNPANLPHVDTPETSSRLICRLPVETLECILELVLRPLDSKTYYRDLHKMALVCQTWSGVIRDSPGLWSIIDDGNVTLEVLLTILSRSKAHPLTILNYMPGRPPNDAALFEHVGRWLDVSIPCLSATVLPSLLAKPAPILRQATFISMDHVRKPLANLFDGQAPNLRYLSFRRCWVEFDSQIYQQLRVLKLSEISFEEIPLGDFVRSLAGCQKLVSLSLKNVVLLGWPAEGEADVIPEEVVILPSLKTLRTKFISSIDALAFFNSIKLPRCAKMTHRYTAWPLPPFLPVPFVSSAPTAALTFKAMVASATHITVVIKYRYSHGDVNISCSMHGRKMLDLRVNAVLSPVQMLSDLAADWGFDAVTAPITILLSYPKDTPDELVGLLTMLHNFPSTTKLILQQSCLTALVFTLTALSDPYVIDNHFRWICPKLEDLLVIDCEECAAADEAVLDMLKRRYGDEYEVPDLVFEGELIIHRPASLKHLVLQGAESNDDITEAAGAQTRVIVDSDEFALPAGASVPDLDHELDGASDSEWDAE